jgi:hypothetical protein
MIRGRFLALSGLAWGRRSNALVGLAAALFWAVPSVVSGAASWELFPADADTYNYAPCAVEDGTHFFWWCQNSEPRRIVDHLYFRRYDFARQAWTPRELALAPGAPGTWDGVHVCDPSVIRGRFRDGGTEYGWLLAYLGCDTLTNCHNQVGLALAAAPGGPWVRYRGNPVVSGSAATWGSGQPSLVSLDQAGRVALFYTRQEDDLSTYTYLSELDLSDLAAAHVGPPVRLSTAGLTERGAAPPVLHDADFALAATGDLVYVVRPLAAGELTLANHSVRLPSVVQVARAEWAAIRQGEGRWTVLAEVGPEQTGFAFGHSAAFGRDPAGRLAGSGRLRLNLAVGSRQADPLWSYTLHGVLLELP